MTHTPVSERLLVGGGLPVAGGIVGVNVELEWPRPTRPGDALYVESEIVDVRPSQTRPTQGVVTARGENAQSAQRGGPKDPGQTDRTPSAVLTP
jgi:acyl dehydratase